MIFDDCLGSAVYSKPRKLNALATYSRHVGQLKEGGAIGVSLFFLVQSYKCQSGGLNKVVRNQCTALMVFRTKDAAELDDIASSVAGEIDRPTFDRVYGAAIGDGEGHPFLLVDFARRPTHASMFRRRLNEFIVLWRRNDLPRQLSVPPFAKNLSACLSRKLKVRPSPFTIGRWGGRRPRGERVLGYPSRSCVAPRTQLRMAQRDAALLCSAVGFPGAAR